MPVYAIADSNLYFLGIHKNEQARTNNIQLEDAWEGGIYHEWGFSHMKRQMMNVLNRITFNLKPEDNIDFSRNTSNFEVKVLKYEDLDSELINLWAELEGRAIESNAYLSPYFILPALKHLTPNTKPIIIIIENNEGGNRKLTGVGVFEFTYGTKKMPLPHLKAYRSTHSFLTGLLIDKNFVEPTITAFFSFFCKQNSNWHGVEFMDRYRDTELASELDKVASRVGYTWFNYDMKQRAILIPKENGANFLPHSRMKDLRRCMKKLSGAGDVQWRIIRSKQGDREPVDVSLKLEHMGWKGANGTSLLSERGHEAFFREMIDGFSLSERAFFTELSLNGEVIASTSNLISGKSGFAFKVGWNPAFSKMSPGILNEVEFVNNAVTLFPELDYIYSGAEEGSYIDELWKGRRTLVSGFYATSSIGKKVLSGTDRLRSIKRKLTKLLEFSFARESKTLK